MWATENMIVSFFRWALVACCVTKRHKRILVKSPVKKNRNRPLNQIEEDYNRGINQKRQIVERMNKRI
jgi:hypothetical protein